MGILRDEIDAARQDAIRLKQLETQSKSGSPPKKLVGDANRQATALFKGLDYQIWLTIAAWIDLGEEQVLEIEGVEDFDVVNHESGITTQAKALTQPISLRSAAVIDAVRNFWIAKHSNRQRGISFNSSSARSPCGSIRPTPWPKATC